jgi:hypothetical protein
MKIKNILLSSLIASSTLFAGGNIAQSTVPTGCVIHIEDTKNSWKTTASLYMLGAGISGETALNGDIDITFKDIMDNFEMGFMANIALQKGNLGLEADFIYLNLGNSIEDTLLIDSFDFTSWIVTPIATYTLLDTPTLDLQLLAGARYFSMEPTLNNRSTSGDIWDGIVGIKGNYHINEKWFIPFRADVGGGDSDSTWQGFTGLGYQYKTMDVVLGYRHIEWRFDESHPAGDIFNDITISGPILGMKFHF